MELTLQEIARQRLSNQLLTGCDFTTPEEIVSWFGAIQAQEYALTKWGLGLRLPYLRDADVEQALTDGRILRTHLLRPTWHLVAAEDIRWMLQLTAPHVQAGNAYMYRKEELDARLFKRCHKIISKALAGGSHLTRTEINDHFRKQKIEAGGLRLSNIMEHAELEGLICSGPRNGNQTTYALLEERVPTMPTIQREESLLLLTKRYFQSRGPAIAADFATWSGLSLKDARAGIAASGMVAERMDGLDYYSVKAGAAITKNVVHLLPPYDEYIMGYKNREAMMHLLKNSTSRTLFDNMIVQNGQIAGSWRRKMGKKSVELEYHFLQPEKGLAASFGKVVGRFEKFVGLPVNLIEK